MRLRAWAAEAGAAALGLAGSLALFWPGTALYDSVAQYRQAVSGELYDWHPPVMARLWSVLALVWPGTAPMLVLQLGLYWVGLGLLAAALARRGRRGAGWAVLAMGVGPILSCWPGAVLKDAQMLGALAAATGIAAWYVLGGRRRPVWATAAILLLLVYADLVRSNAAFAAVPFGLALFGWPGMRRVWARAAGCVAAILLVLALAPAVNHRLLGARPERPENSLLLYDIVGTSIRAGTDSAGVPAARWRTAAAQGCYSALEWDALSEPPRCRIRPGLAPCPQTPPLYGEWVATIVRHPLAYAAHRLAHFNMTMRFVVPSGVPRLVGPVDSEPNRLGLGAAPGPAERGWWQIGTAWGATPLAWPALWLALACAGLWASRAAPDGSETRLARALLLSACCGGLSYALVSVASDLRYHLWTMLAASLGLLLLAAGGELRRPHWIGLGTVALLVSGAGIAARLALPPWS